MTAPAIPAVFLDRDGTLIRTFYAAGGPVAAHRIEDVEILPRVRSGLATLKGAGFPLVMVTNQPDVARGTLSRATVEAINAMLCRQLPIDEVMCCYHDDADGCSCRKPAPGMLVDAATRLGLHLPLSYVVGDRWRDIEAGRRAGCTTILLRTTNPELHSTKADFEATNLDDAAGIIVRSRRERTREAFCR